MTYLVIDLETSMLSKDTRGKPTSDCFHDTILTIGLKYQKPRQLMIHLAVSDTYALPIDVLPKGALDEISLLIGHNIAFDLKFLWRNPELQEFFLRGGRIWDTQLVEYIISGQRHKYPGLRDIAVNKYGCSPRIKHIEGLLTQDVPLHLLLEDVRNDVLDTEQVAFQQVKTVKQEGMTGLIKTQMDSRLCTIEMEFNGFRVNQEILEQNQQELESQLEPITEEINTIAKKHWPEELEFNIQSPQQLALLFFGGEYKIKEKIQEGYFKNGNPKMMTVIVNKPMLGLAVKPHKDWVTETGKRSVNEKVLKNIAK